MELRSKRNTLWEQTKAFLEKHRGENGLVEASAVEQYNKMAGEVQALGAEIERLEQQAALDAALSAPTSKPVTNAPGTKNTPPTNPTATDEYKSAFWDMIRNKGDQLAVRNALSVGEDTGGGYTGAGREQHLPPDGNGHQDQLRYPQDSDRQRYDGGAVDR